MLYQRRRRCFDIGIMSCAHYGGSGAVVKASCLDCRRSRIRNPLWHSSFKETKCFSPSPRFFYFTTCKMLVHKCCINVKGFDLKVIKYSRVAERYEPRISKSSGGLVICSLTLQPPNYLIWIFTHSLTRPTTSSEWKLFRFDKMKVNSFQILLVDVTFYL